MLHKFFNIHCLTHRVIIGKLTFNIIKHRLKITSSDWFGTHMLTPILAEFAILHPGITVELITEARFFNLSRREADLAFRISPFKEPDVVSRKLLHMPYGVYARKGMKRKIGVDGKGASLIALDTGFAGAPDDSWLQKKLPKRRWCFAATAGMCKPKCVNTEPALRCCPCHWASALLVSKESSWATSQRVAIPGWATIAI